MPAPDPPEPLSPLHRTPPVMRDRELSVVLAARKEGDDAKGWVPWYEFALRADDCGEPVGRLNLRVGDTPHVIRAAGHIGYSVVPAWRGRRFAARALRLVLPFAHACGLDPVWITCNPDNPASLRTLEIVGATRVDEVDVPPGTDMYERGETRKVRFRIDSPGPTD